MNLTNLVFVDCEAAGTSPVNGVMTEFGAVHYATRVTFHGVLFESTPDPDCPAIPVPGKRVASGELIAIQFAEWLSCVCTRTGRPVMVSDNPAYDFMWIAGLFDAAGMANPLGHSARRISDFWAGLNRDWGQTRGWKNLRRTKHDHHPVNDAMGNVEAFERVIQMMREGRFGEDLRGAGQGAGLGQ